MSSMMRRFSGLCTATVVAAGMLAITPAQANGSFEHNVDYIMSSTGADPQDQEIREEIIQGIEEYAAEYGLGVEEAAQAITDESRTYSTNTFGSKESTLNQPTPQSGSGQRKVAMNVSRYIGDIFYSSNSTLGITHGHNGIYNRQTHYIEAAGFSRGVVETYAGHAVAPAPAHKYYVGWDKQSPNKKKAARFAEAQKGKGYNGVFFNNKQVYSSTYNCSQLVWAAYKSVDPNIDLDSNGGSGVYPADIANSHWTTRYETHH